MKQIVHAVFAILAISASHAQSPAPGAGGGSATQEEQLHSEGSERAKKGVKLYKEGKKSEALPVFVEGWTRFKSVDCLKGLSLILMDGPDGSSLAPYSEALLEYGNKDQDCLKMLIWLCTHTENGDLFNRCLVSLRGNEEILDDDQELQLALSKAAVHFALSKEEQEKKAKEPKGR